MREKEQKAAFKSPKSASESIIFLRSEQIRPQRAENKSKFEQNTIIRLAQSIQRYGVLQPLSVRPESDENGYPYYELVAGERRYRAALLAGIAKIPCVILRADDIRCAELAVIEQIRHENLTMFEEAMAFHLLMRNYHLTQEDIARKIGLSQSAVANKLRLLRFTEAEQARILQGGLSERHARALLRLTDIHERAEILEQAIRNNCTVAATEALVESHITGQISMANGFLPPKSGTFKVVTPPQAPPKGVLPRKFALQDLTPLYNSIDRTLAIFRKTGAAAECMRQESDSEVQIVIRIPRRA